jgi:integrase
MTEVGDRGTLQGYLSGSQEGNQMTVREALTMYLSRREHLAALSGKPGPDGLYVLTVRAEGFYRPAFEQPVANLPSLLPGLIHAYSKTHAGKTTREAVAEAKHATSYWLHKEIRLLTEDPWDGLAVEDAIRSIPKSKAGKAQLKRGWVLIFVQHCIELAKDKPRGYAAATLLVMYIGLRASEVLRIKKEDLLDDGSVLVVPKAKTDAGVRDLELEPLPRALLRTATKDLRRSDRVFKLSHSRWREWVVTESRRVTPVAVNIQGLRGTFASTALRGASKAGEYFEAGLADIAQYLGQAGTGVTKRHYLAPGAEQTAVAGVLNRRLLKSRG